jgi:hypothetical protein
MEPPLGMDPPRAAKSTYASTLTIPFYYQSNILVNRLRHKKSPAELNRALGSQTAEDRVTRQKKNKDKIDVGILPHQSLRYKVGE